ncbi:MAG: ribonuclease H-like domain-containing protein [Brevinematales bacterium]|nr:ribonuclease H-like domain-containing protein [Brevinematales bacterium]
MLRHTFCHLKGVGKKRESILWEHGILCWEDALERKRLDSAVSGHTTGISPELADSISRGARESIERLAAGDLPYFMKHLHPSEHWRVFREFRAGTAYFDIETDGLSNETGRITTVSLYDGRAVNTYINGGNLGEFPDEFSAYRLIVSYNGKCFDVPFINHYFGIHVDIPHIDLCPVMHSLGFYGGLKGTEKALGIDRGELDGVDGYFAVLLWNEYENHDNINALETLLAYNIEDVVNLEFLMIEAYNRKIGEYPAFRHNTIPVPERPEIPFKPDYSLVQRYRQKFLGAGANLPPRN